VTTVRPADVPAVVAACDWLFAPPGSTPPRWDPEIAAERLLGMCDKGSAAAFVAVDPALVGFCTVYLDLVSIRMGQRAWLNELAVDPTYRSRGIGHDLLAAATSWARDHGATHLMVDSNITRTDAHRFYRRETPDFEANAFGWLL